MLPPIVFPLGRIRIAGLPQHGVGSWKRANSSCWLLCVEDALTECFSCVRKGSALRWLISYMRRACCLHRARAAGGLFLRTAWRPRRTAIPALCHRLCAPPPKKRRPRCRRPRRQQWPPATQCSNEACLGAGHRARARRCRRSSHGSPEQSLANRPRATLRWKRRWRWHGLPKL